MTKFCSTFRGFAFYTVVVVCCQSFAAEPKTVDFVRDVWPILQRACIECHGAEKHEGNLRLDLREHALRGGDSGPALTAKEPAKSELLRRIALPQGDDEVMPARGDTLSKRDIATLRQWIQQGANWPAQISSTKHWAYVVPVRPMVPNVTAHAERIANPIDRFVLARLNQEHGKPSPQADPASLIRRVSLDLIGLPPSPDEVAQFVRESTPVVSATAHPSVASPAYARLVERLLASPRFGERWARPWLDLARYADSHGFQRDDLREIWAYRDWVITALNNDMPFDQFTIEQVAGDLLPNATESQHIATGFHRCSTTNVEAGSDPEETRTNQVVDRVNTTGAVWLGTTLECAQCHSHKYDPFSQREYYQLLAYFNNTALEADRANPKVPGSIKFLGPTMPLSGERTTESLKKARKEPAKEKKEDKKKASDNPAEKDKPPAAKPATTLVMRELSEPRPAMIYQRGDFRSPGEAVTAGVPAVLHAIPAGPENRLTLARWLVDRQNPLTARVTVNRWWAELFGRGLVSTVEDFGIKGEPPTHPELLDWLAVEFMESGWSMKHVLRTIVMSSTYQQSSRRDTAPIAAGSSDADFFDDPDNLLLARGPRFRLDAETIRDNALAAAGLLSRKQGGPPVRPYQPDGLWTKVGGDPLQYVVSPGEDAYRRGVYVVWKRAAPYPSFVNFDATARMTCTVKRSRSNTPLQALTLLNDPVYVEIAEALSQRVLAELPHGSTDEQLRLAFQLCVARTPRDAEQVILKKLFDQQLAAHKQDAAAAWFAIAAALLNLDETITKN